MTAAAHEEVDAAFSRFDLDDRDSHTGFRGLISLARQSGGAVEHFLSRPEAA
jgi:hypothetical protein